MFELLREGIRIYSRHVRVSKNGLKKYSGNDEGVSRKIISACYDTKKRYFKTSAGHYTFFYARDFGWCTEALLNLGFTKEVHNTLKYVIEIYEKNDKITVAINDAGKPFNFPDIYSPDSVAYLYRSLRISKAKDLIKKHGFFLNEQAKVFENEVLDADGMLRLHEFSGMRDYIKATALCYDMIMACMLCDEIELINNMVGKDFIYNPLKKYDLKKELMKYWNGTHFIDNFDDKYCSGHANTYPYFLNVITDEKMLKSSIKSIQKSNLDKPFPLKYGYSKNTKFIWLNFFAKDWEKNTEWAMLGMAYIDIVSKVDKKLAKKYLEQYKELILKHHCFIEVYNDYEPYKSTFYTADDSMLWASMYLDLKKRLK